jgi:RNA recognition motif-containing protein
MSTEEARKLFVAGLPDSITEDILRQLFEATGGTVVEVSLPKDRATGRPRGFGFVTLSSSAEAQVARESLDGSMQAGKSISVRPFQAEPPKREGGGMGGPRSERGAGGPSAADRTIYVGNLPYDASQAEVEALFSNSNAGPVVRVSLPTDEEGRKRGFGFVTMASAEVANAAIEALRGADLRGRSLIVNLARPKGEGGGGGGGGYAGGGGSYAGGGGGGFSGSSPPFRSSPGPAEAGGGGGGGPAAARGRKQYDKRRNTEGEGPRKKAWDRERGGGRVDPSDWGDD